VDTVSPETRSRIMSRIKSRDTKPEAALRSLLWRRGLRFRKHRKDLPGRPDAAFASARVALFLDGDFWHGRAWAETGKAPETNRGFWTAKFERNRARDVEADAALLGAGWLPIRVWESDFKKDPEGTAERVEETVRSRMPPPESSARRAERSPS